MLGGSSGGTWGHGEQEEYSALGSLVLNTLTSPGRICLPCVGHRVVKHHGFAPRSRSEPAQEWLRSLHVGDGAENKIWERGRKNRKLQIHLRLMTLTCTTCFGLFCFVFPSGPVSSVRQSLIKYLSRAVVYSSRAKVTPCSGKQH